MAEFGVNPDEYYSNDPKRRRQVARTKSAITDILNDRKTADFPPIDVMYRRSVLRRSYVTRAFEIVISRRLSQGKEGFDWIGAMRDAMPLVLDEAKGLLPGQKLQRSGRFASSTVLTCGRERSDVEAAAESLRNSLQAPLVLDAPE